MNKNITAIKESLKIYDKELKERVEKYESDQKQIRETYQQQIAFVLLDDLKIDFDNDIQEMKDQGKKYCESKFKQLKDLIDEIIIQKLSDDFADTLQLIKFLGDKISKTEVNAFIEKYKDNYLEIRSLFVALKDNENLKGLNVISSDDILASIDEMQRKVNSFFDYPDTYEYIVMLTEAGPLEKFDKYIMTFINKKFIYNINDLLEEDLNG